mmetsp:Transcript_6088/g.7326  ORF Transcript_6088/g.7326 Transcript_6088/m.7326 type:complete len:427 (+) Transcript_6088:257-1537(+)
MSETDLPKLSCGRAHTAAIVKDRLITFGRGSNGELGTGEKVDRISPQIVSVVDIQGTSDKAVAVSCGLSHTCVLTEKGSVYGFGLNKNGQLGARNEIVLTPEKFKLPYQHGVKSVSCGSHYTAVLLGDDLGNIIIFGNGLRCEFQASEQGYTYLKRGEYMSLKERVVKIAAGFEHLLLLTDIGRLYAVGNGQNGRLGVKFVSTSEGGEVQLVKTTPYPVKCSWSDEKIVHISAGEKHSALVNSSGKVFTWGCGTSGQLGLGKFMKQLDTPTKLELPNMVWAKSNNRKERSRRDSIPNVIELEAFAVGVACGSNHTIVTLLNGNVVGFGANAYGQTGSASNFFQTHDPEVIRQGELQNPASYKVLHAAGGDSHTALLCEDSSVLMCGNQSLCGGNTAFSIKARNRAKSILPSRLCLEEQSCVKRQRQ